MNRAYVSLMLLLLLPLSSLAAQSGFDDLAFLARSKPIQSVITYLIQEDCEGTGTPANWFNFNTPNWDYSASPLAGLQSFQTTNSSSSTNIMASTYSTLFGFLLLKVTASGTDQDFFRLKTSTGAVVGRMSLRSAVQFRISHGGTTSTITALTLDQLYYIWWDWTISTGGNNGVMHMYISTTTTKPAATLTITNGDATTDVGQIMLSGATGNGFIADNIYVSTSDITGVP